MGRIVSKKELAEVVGVSERTLSDWQEKGMPIKVHTSRGHANEYDTADVIAWRVEFVASGERSEKPRDRKDLAQAQLYELQLAEKSGQFLQLEDVEQAIASAITSARAEFMSSARKLKTKIDKEYEIDVELEFIIEHVHSTLTKFSEHAPEFGGDDEAGVVEVGAAITA